MRIHAIDRIMLIIMILGAVNWAILGVFHVDIIAYLFGTMSWATRIIYLLIGMSGIYGIALLGLNLRTQKNHPEPDALEHTHIR